MNLVSEVGSYVVDITSRYQVLQNKDIVQLILLVVRVYYLRHTQAEETQKIQWNNSRLHPVFKTKDFVITTNKTDREGKIYPKSDNFVTTLLLQHTYEKSKFLIGYILEIQAFLSFLIALQLKELKTFQILINYNLLQLDMISI